MEQSLLHLVIANHFLLRPPEHDDQRSLEKVRAPRHEASHLPPGPARIVAAVLADPADRRTLGEWSQLLGVDPVTLSREFSTCVGEPFVRWRATVRMSEARALLWAGREPSTVARRLGFAHLSTFSRAFSSFHGMPPTEWLRREAA